MDYDRPEPTIADIHEAHRKRFEAGRRMFELLQERRNADDDEDTDMAADRAEKLEEARTAVKTAENRALQLDPNLRHVPRDLVLPPDTED